MEIMLSSLGWVRLAVVTPELKVADVRFNTKKMIRCLEECAEKGVQMAVFPELCVTGYTCADLFYQAALLEEAKASIDNLAQCSENIALAVGIPIQVSGKIYNCAAFVANGRVVGICPKTFLPNANEFYEKRWFTSAQECPVDEIEWNGQKIPFGRDLLFRANGYKDCLVGIEICEDLWAPCAPSVEMAMQGATILLNLSASNEVLGKLDYRSLLIKAQSGRCLCAYAYASAGPGESTTDLVFSGDSMIAENGALLAQTERYSFESQMAIAEVDVQRLLHERIKSSSFAQSRPFGKCRTIPFDLVDRPVGKPYRSISPFPFVPFRVEERSERCKEIFAMQTTALSRRIKNIASSCSVIGVSGGLDSTLALLVAVKTFDRLGLPRKKILAVTMPGFGTTQRTRSNAENLSQRLGVSLRVVPIGKAVEQHFHDIGHDPAVQDVTYENAQARERTQILMDLANEHQGIVIGTGDLSELALGWCTYNGDHMSMYGVNAGVPKTLVRYLVEWCAECEFSGEVSRILKDICATPISPELLPHAGENSQQLTEEKIGPYALHDFFLYHVVRLQFPPLKVLTLAQMAFEGRYSLDEIRRCLETFYRRFFSQQYKRSCLPDGPKVGTVSLSPRGDWRMPSDASSSLWIDRLTD